ncbi:cytotoxic family protein, partial [Klebsiella pneumoniae]
MSFRSTERQTPTPAQVKQRLEEEKRRQQAWDAAHPEEGLKREYDKAKA